MTKTLTLYSREGCHLCAQMRAELDALLEAPDFPRGISIHAVDIDADPELRRRFNAEVPVLALGDEIICFHFLDEPVLRQALSHG
jgi:glutaredoxin